MDINIEKKRIKDFSNFNQKINNKLKALGGSIRDLIILNQDLLKKKILFMMIPNYRMI